MSFETCGIIVHRQRDIVGFQWDGSYLAECIRINGHLSGPHIIKTPDGKYYAWEDGDDCDCCDPEDDDDWCYTHWEMTKEEAESCITKI